MKHTIFLTGGSGYVGAMLAEQFSKRGDVEKIICLDKEPKSEIFNENSKVVFVQKNTSDDWEEEVAKYNPDTVIHTAWQIREMYGQKDLQWRWNITGSEKVFDFAFSQPSVERLIHFSTVASYYADPKNTIEQRFTENDPFRRSDYLYAEEKRIVEEKLKERFGSTGRDSDKQVFIIRPAAITGPRGRFSRIRFGLQSALSGQLKTEKNIWYSLVSTLVSFTPITKKWVRQFIHEDDINDIVELLTFSEKDHFNKMNISKYEVFNACPPGPVVLGADMARAVGKKPVILHPWLIRTAFFFMWHLSLGKIPTSKGGWKSYSYPIAVDGSKITKLLGYNYKMNSLDAFTKNEGRYKLGR